MGFWELGYNSELLGISRNRSPETQCSYVRVGGAEMPERDAERVLIRNAIAERLILKRKLGEQVERRTRNRFSG